MGTRPTGFNLTIGQNGLSYQDVMCLSRLQLARNRRNFDANRQSMPSARGSHSEISGI
jgi:hypothetical protein